MFNRFKYDFCAHSLAPAESPVLRDRLSQRDIKHGCKFCNMGHTSSNGILLKFDEVQHRLHWGTYVTSFNQADSQV